MPKDLLHAIPVFALTLFVLLTVLLQFVFQKIRSKPSADGETTVFVLKTPLRFLILYAALVVLSVAVVVVSEMFDLSSTFTYLMSGVVAAFGLWELLTALFARTECGEEGFVSKGLLRKPHSCAMGEIAEVRYKKSFSGETLKIYTQGGKFLEADASMTGFPELKALLEDREAERTAIASDEETSEEIDGN